MKKPEETPHKMRIAIYPGTFDPLTNGHLDVIDRSARLFDKIIVAVGRNPNKNTLFSADERVAMLKEALADRSKVEVSSFSGLLVSYAKEMHAKVIIRGLRAVSDFDFEFQRALMNRKADPDIETVFIMTRGAYCYLNSSIVKEAAQFGGPLEGLVPDVVQIRLRKKFPR